MKSLFIATAAVSGVVSFFFVKEYRENEQKKFDHKMNAVDAWMSKSTLK